MFDIHIIHIFYDKDFAIFLKLYKLVNYQIIYMSLTTFDFLANKKSSKERKVNTLKLNNRTHQAGKYK